MTIVPKDPLLTAARWIINVTVAFCGLGILFAAIGLPLLLLNQQRVTDALLADGKTVVAADFIPAAVAIMVLLAAFLLLSVWFLLLLRQIVGTVAAGDPFIRDNATRLSRMGWIALGAQAISIFMGGAVIWLAGMVEDHDSVRLDDDVSFDGWGIVLVIILFVLARVFRQGAAMREELEGTV